MSIELYGYVLTRYLNIVGYVFISLLSRGAIGTSIGVFKVKSKRITIELAKIRKENSSLKKELSKFFPSKNSIESASKKN